MRSTPDPSESSTDDPESGSDRSTSTGPERTPVSRRTFLGRAAIGGLAAAGLPAVVSRTAAAVPRADEYGTVIDMVEEGADDTGTESITPVLESVRGDDTLLYFPPGRYYMDSQFRYTGFENVGVVGEDATLVPATYYEFDGPQYRLFRLGTSSTPGRRIRFEGFEVDQTAPETGIRVVEAYAVDRLDIVDVRVRGVHDSGTFGPFLANVLGSDGTGLVENVRAPDGGAWIDETPHTEPGGLRETRGPDGMLANQTEGTLRFKDCVIGGFPNHGLYASTSPGRIVVEGGHYSNSNPVSLRIGGTDSEVRSVTVEVDETRPQDVSQRGIQVGNGNVTIRDATVRITSPMPNSHAIAVLNSSSGTRIEGTRVEISGDRPNSGIVISPDAGRTTIADTEILHDVPRGYPLWARGSGGDPLTCSHVRVTEETVIDGSNDGVYCVEDGESIPSDPPESDSSEEEPTEPDSSDESGQPSDTDDDVCPTDL
ncbi:right-handed parallel beta-helix repeat-containing protein [Saliphagus sp. LR7]|uniref:right-handed parallel beta-helix repeat-containing protein n=1 Tax=Saliphagus sp. LR7 TaxID=2282654 RepID=UPI000DF81A51|nr:right-handed parallel beta-helix repeat-containing protein [Saliphagus sp. LR7]